MLAATEIATDGRTSDALAVIFAPALVMISARVRVCKSTRFRSAALPVSTLPGSRIDPRSVRSDRASKKNG